VTAPRTGPRAWVLPAELRAQVATLATDLGAYVDDRASVYVNRPARWRDSDEGTAVDAWIDTLQAVAQSLEALPTEPETTPPR
jgi:hypothetical protein